MLKEFLNRLIELKRPEIIEDNKGIEYLMNNEYSPIKDALTPGFKTSSLSSIVDYIKSNFDNIYEKFVIHVVDYETVKLHTAAFGPFKQRECLVTACAETPEFSFGRYIDQENFIVALLSKFQETEGREYALGIASNIVEDEEIKLVDNGLAQTAMFKRGVAAIDNDKVVPYVNMKPYRTFIEIDQPESIFLLRLRKGGQLALHEADGGAWKKTATERIAEYFVNEFNDFDNVKVMA